MCQFATWESNTDAGLLLLPIVFDAVHGLPNRQDQVKIFSCVALFLSACCLWEGPAL
jgi:hypothetical protein